LTLFSLDVVNGMKYVASKGCVHRDLSARNCLVFAGQRVKIADFGLSRRVELVAGYYRKQGEEKLPFRWLAPECIMDGIWSQDSDVWSYGVTLWEIWTLGHMPYPGWHVHEVCQAVVNGYHMPPPPKSPRPIAEVMLRCWDRARPSFSKLAEMLQNYATFGGSLDVDVGKDMYTVPPLERPAATGPKDDGTFGRRGGSRSVGGGVHTPSAVNDLDLAAPAEWHSTANHSGVSPAKPSAMSETPAAAPKASLQSAAALPAGLPQPRGSLVQGSPRSSPRSSSRGSAELTLAVTPAHLAVSHRRVEKRGQPRVSTTPFADGSPCRNSVRYASNSPSGSPIVLNQSVRRNTDQCSRRGSDSLIGGSRPLSVSPGGSSDRHHYYKIRFKAGRETDGSLVPSLVDGQTELVGLGAQAPGAALRSLSTVRRGRHRASTDPTPVKPSTLAVRFRVVF
jgi:serine/threonine protein kinase